MEKFTHNGVEYRSRSLAALALVDEGMSLGKAAKIVGISPKTVFAAKKRRKVGKIETVETVSDVGETVTPVSESTVIEAPVQEVSNS